MAAIIYVGTALKGVLNNLEYRKVAAIIMAAEATLKIVVFYIFLKFLPGSATTLLSSAILALLLTLAPLIWAVSRLPAVRSGDVERVDSLEVLKFAYPISISAVINWIQTQGYRMVMVPLGLAELVGIFATVSGIGNAGMLAASSVFGQIFIPKIYKTAGSYTKTYIRNALLLAIGVLVFGAVFSNLIVDLLTKDEFRRFSWLIVYGIIAEAGNFIIGALSVDLTIRSETKVMLRASVLGLVTTVGIFILIFALKLISVYTIGLPGVLSQITVATYLYTIFHRGRTLQRKLTDA
jgi:O-antigen/teichoic acid export membrane protein